MNTVMSNQLNAKIIATLDFCIDKMADIIRQTFDFEICISRSLFQFFCSSIKTRATFMKSIEKQIDKAIENTVSLKSSLNSQPEAKPFDESVLSFTPPKKSGKDYQNPLDHLDLKSGLLIKK
jgi:hypothetical protein